MIGEDLQKFSESRCMRTMEISRIPVCNRPNWQSHMSLRNKLLTVLGMATPTKQQSERKKNIQEKHFGGSPEYSSRRQSTSLYKSQDRLFYIW
ncbi:hypothetical protein AVEN_252050-1 [Araneus ventricosus]|uniref:Uncharacterized protein n=1 Tax=Araneus ventricosus TaxID=182803 RepID=A0A4Y2WM35_ARAVE|nr:hypothetical protein AVEN_252050-1 [Araneus ventricosus]